MKKMKKIFALLIAMVMVLGMSTSVFAATIKVTQSSKDGTTGEESYEAYKVFDVTKTADQADYKTTEGGPGTEEGFAYFVDAESAWVTVLQKSGQNWVKLTPSADGSQYSVEWIGDNTEDAAKAFADWLLANKGDITADYTFKTGDTKEVADGYYLITSSLGTNLILATSNIEIQEKNEYVSDDKEVEESNYSVGDYAKYDITVTLPASVDYTKTVTVHDSMDKALSLVAATTGANAWSAKVGETDFTSHVTLSTGKTDKHDESAHEIGENQVGFDFVIDISSLAPAEGEEAVEKTIVITYYAEVTTEAVADNGYINKEFTEYSNYTTNPNQVEVKTYDFDLEKTDGSGDPLSGAVFQLKAENSAEADAIDFIEVNGGYKKADNETADADKVTDLEAGAINVAGLGAGTYYLFEIEAPKGYNKIEKAIIVTIAEDGTVTLGDGSDSQGTLADSKITVKNQEGTALPSTGGIGTTMFYVIGAILVIGAGVVLVTRRRMSVK